MASISSGISPNQTTCGLRLPAVRQDWHAVSVPRSSRQTATFWLAVHPRITLGSGLRWRLPTSASAEALAFCEFKPDSPPASRRLRRAPRSRERSGSGLLEEGPHHPGMQRERCLDWLEDHQHLSDFGVMDEATRVL